jgi:hypothetical protein
MLEKEHQKTVRDTLQRRCPSKGFCILYHLREWENPLTQLACRKKHAETKNEIFLIFSQAKSMRDDFLNEKNKIQASKTPD